MRVLHSTSRAVMATALTAALAVASSAVASDAMAQTRAAQPPRAPRAAAAPRDSQPGQPRARRAVPPQGQLGPIGRGPAGGILRLRAQLELTDDQVKRLEALQTVPPQDSRSDVMRAQADLLDATRGDVNLEKARAALDRMAKIRTDGQIARLKAAQDVRNVLTPAQKTKLDAFQQGRRQQMRGAMRGMMRDGMRDRMRDGMRGQMRQGPGMGQGMGPGMGQQGMGPGMRPQGMGPGMGPQGMGPGMGPQGGMRRRQGPPGGPDAPMGPPQGAPARGMMQPRPPMPPTGATPPDTTS